MNQQGSQARADSNLEIRTDLATNGYVHLKHVNLQQYQELARSLGSLRLQQDGKEIYDVKARPGYENRRYSGSCNEIGPHTEFPYFPTPPSYLGLFCVEPAHCNGGRTFLGDSITILDKMMDCERTRLQEISINFSSTVFSNGEDDPNGTHAVLSVSGQKPIVRFSHNFFAFGDTDARADAEFSPPASPFSKYPELVKINELFDQCRVAIKLERGECLIWDNHRMLHAREAYSDQNRWLKRVVIQ